MIKSKKKSWLISIIILLIIIIIVICYQMFENNNRELKMIYIPKVIDEDNEFWSALTAGAKMAANEYNVDLIIIAPNKEEDYQKQNELIYWAIEQKPDAIIISPCDYTETIKAAKEVVKNGMHLIFIDSDVKEPVYESIIATDNFIAGIKMGEIAKEYITSDTQIAIVGHVKTPSTAMERIRGFTYSIGEHADQIVDTVFCDSMFDKAYKITLELMEKYPDINLVIGTNEYAAVGAAEAIKDKGLDGTVKMVGFDNSIELVQLLEEDIFQGIVVQKPFNMGYLGIEQAVKIVKGQNYQKVLDSGSELITKDNMYTEENQKLLFPFLGRQFRETEAQIFE